MSLSPQVLELLRLIREERTSQQLLHELQGHHGFEFVEPPPGAMTDAPKRRLDPHETGSEQRPHIPKTVNSKDEFPPGINSLEEWGHTLLKHGKLAKAQKSYDEVFQSKDPEMVSYCKYVLTLKTRTDLTAPMRDFVDYVVRRTSSVSSSTMYFPGSTVIREMKQ